MKVEELNRPKDYSWIGPACFFRNNIGSPLTHREETKRSPILDHNKLILKIFKACDEILFWL